MTVKTSKNNLCFVASIEMVFEEENYFTVVLLLLSPDLLGNKYKHSHFSFHIMKNQYSLGNDYNRFLVTDIENKINRRYLFAFSNQSYDNGFSFDWRFDYLLEPREIDVLLLEGNLGGVSDD